MRDRDSMAETFPDLKPAPKIIVADSFDDAALVSMAASTKVVIASSGPFGTSILFKFGMELACLRQAKDGCCVCLFRIVGRRGVACLR